jgi:gamma-glutamyltranspeptidase / glutathione hydrolase
MRRRTFIQALPLAAAGTAVAAPGDAQEQAADAAANSPRWYHEGSSQSMGEDRPNLGSLGILWLESGVPAETRKALLSLGWSLGHGSDGFFGCYESIERRKQGSEWIYAAGGEVRADAVAPAY